MSRRRAPPAVEPRSADKFLSDASLILNLNLDYPTAFDRIAQLAVPFLADWCAIDVVEPGGAFHRVAVAHIEPKKAALAREIQSRFAADPNVSVGYPKVLRTGKSDFWPDVLPSQLAAAARNEEHLALLQKLGFRSYMCVPLLARGRTLGSMTFVSVSTSRRFSPDDLAIAEELGRRAGMTLDNARLFHETEQARARAALLAETSRLLAVSSEPAKVLQQIADLCVPALGDWCSIRLLDETGNMLGPPVMAHLDRKMLELAISLRKRYPLPQDLGPMRVLATGKSELYPEVDEELLKRLARDPEHLRILRTIAPKSSMIVPIKTHARVIGAVHFVSTSTRRFAQGDLELAEDLAHRIALAVENARLHASAAEAIRARDELFSVASHEMRTPLGALHLMMRVLRNSLDAGRPPAEVARALASKIEIADRQVSRVTKLVNKLLDISKLKAGGMLLEREDVDLAEIGREVVARFEEEAARAGSTLRLSAEEPVPGFHDRFRIEQIFTNLLSNAIKYGSGKPIEVGVSRRDALARIVVSDRGIGITEEQREKLFERHSRGQKAYDGLGLGLYIVRQIVEESGGKISLESTVGKGASFIVDLPLRPVAPSPE